MIPQIMLVPINLLIIKISYTELKSTKVFKFKIKQSDTSYIEIYLARRISSRNFYQNSNVLNYLF